MCVCAGRDTVHYSLVVTRIIELVNIAISRK